MTGRKPTTETRLVVGKNYGGVFGLAESKGEKMIYNGGISWTAINGEQQMTADDQETTDMALAFSHLAEIKA